VSPLGVTPIRQPRACPTAAPEASSKVSQDAATWQISRGQTGGELSV